MSKPIDIFTVSYFSAVKIGNLINSLRADGQMSFALYVADNTSGDDKALNDLIHKIAQEKSNVSVSLQHMTSNLGYGAAINQLVRFKGNDLSSNFIISNPDVEVLPGAISGLLNALQDNNECGLAGPLILDEIGTPYPSARKFPRLRSGIGHALFARLWPRNPWTSDYHDEDADNAVTRQVDWLSGAFLAVSSKAFTEIEGFSEQFFMYFEDVDLAERLADAGYVRLFVPKSIVMHSGAHSTTKNKRVMLKTHHESAYLYLSAHYSGWYHVPTRLILKVALKVRAGLSK